MNEVRKFYPWLIAAAVGLAVLFGAYGDSSVSAGNPETINDTEAVESPILAGQEIFLVKQGTARVPADHVNLTIRQGTPFARQLPDSTTAAARIVLLGMVVTLWLSTRYFTRLLS